MIFSALAKCIVIGFFSSPASLARGHTHTHTHIYTHTRARAHTWTPLMQACGTLLTSDVKLNGQYRRPKTSLWFGRKISSTPRTVRDPVNGKKETLESSRLAPAVSGQSEACGNEFQIQSWICTQVSKRSNKNVTKHYPTQTHTHTHTRIYIHMYIYIYIERERERERAG